MIQAVIDIGTAAVRLYVAQVEGKHISRIEKGMTITRLGEGAQGGVLQPLPMRRTLDEIARCLRRADSLGARRLNAFATAAVRDAANGPAFVEAARQLGVEVRVLSGEEEAHISFAGATMGVDGPAGVIDVGGGSTETVCGCDGKLHWAKSMPMGAVRALSRWPMEAPASDAQWQALRSGLHDFFAPLRQAVPQGIAQWRAVSGTAYTVVALEKRLEQYDFNAVHNQPISRDTVLAWADRLRRMDLAQRRALAGMHPDRADIIPAGMLCLAEALEAAGAPGFTFSDTDNCEGYLAVYGQ
nr:hypothetical protein [bacterium]